LGESIHLSTILGAAALVLALPRFARLTFRLNINVAALNAYLSKLMKAGHLDRMQKLLSVVPNAAYALLARALVDRAEELIDGERRPPPEVEAALAEVRASKLAEIQREVWKWRFLDLASLILLIVGARAATSGWSEIGGGIGGAALLFLLLSLRLTFRIPRQCKHHSQSLTAGLVDLVVEHQS